MSEIEKYLLDEMTKQEAETFEKKLAGSPSLQRELEEQRQLIEGIQSVLSFKHRILDKLKRKTSNEANLSDSK